MSIVVLEPVKQKSFETDFAVTVGGIGIIFDLYAMRKAIMVAWNWGNGSLSAF